MKKAAALLLAVFLAFSAVIISGCSDGGNEAIVGEWTPSTVSIHGSTIPYSKLDTQGKEFSFNFYSDGKCKIIIGGVSNEGTYTFNETSVDIQYGGKSQRLSYERGIITLNLEFNDQTTSYMFTRVTK